MSETHSSLPGHLYLWLITLSFELILDIVHTKFQVCVFVLAPLHIVVHNGNSALMSTPKNTIRNEIPKKGHNFFFVKHCDLCCIFFFFFWILSRDEFPLPSLSYFCHWLPANYCTWFRCSKILEWYCKSTKFCMWFNFKFPCQTILLSRFA